MNEKAQKLIETLGQMQEKYGITEEDIKTIATAAGAVLAQSNIDEIDAKYSGAGMPDSGTTEAEYSDAELAGLLGGR